MVDITKLKLDMHINNVKIADASSSLVITLIMTHETYFTKKWMKLSDES